MKHIAVQEVLNQEVSRKEFLLQVGATVVAITGVTALMHNLGNIFGNKKTLKMPQSQSYGGSSYAGNK